VLNPPNGDPATAFFLRGIVLSMMLELLLLLLPRVRRRGWWASRRHTGVNVWLDGARIADVNAATVVLEGEHDCSRQLSVVILHE